MTPDRSFGSAMLMCRLGIILDGDSGFTDTSPLPPMDTRPRISINPIPPIPPSVPHYPFSVPRVRDAPIPFHIESGSHQPQASLIHPAHHRDQSQAQAKTVASRQASIHSRQVCQAGQACQASAEAHSGHGLHTADPVGAKGEREVLGAVLSAVIAIEPAGAFGGDE